MRGRALLALLVAASRQREARADDGANTTHGVAGIVPRGYTEVCVLRGDLPVNATRESGALPSPFVILTYGRRVYESPPQEKTLSPVWQGSGCTTLPTATAIEGFAIELRIELWDDRTRAYDPLSVVYKNEMLGAGAVAADTTFELWLTLDPTTVEGARVLVAVTIAPPYADGSIAGNPNTFRTLTSTPAFFVYVGAATLTIIVCVCCLWGKGVAPPPRLLPLERARTDPEKPFSLDPAPGRPAHALPSQSAALPHPPRKALTVEVATPPAGRGMHVVQVPAPPAEAARQRSPGTRPPAPAASRWPTLPSNLFGGDSGRVSRAGPE